MSKTVATALAVLLITIGIGGTTYAQKENNGNPSILQAVEQLQASVNALQSSVNSVETNVTGGPRNAPGVGQRPDCRGAVQRARDATR